MRNEHALIWQTHCCGCGHCGWTSCDASACLNLDTHSPVTRCQNRETIHLRNGRNAFFLAFSSHSKHSNESPQHTTPSAAWPGAIMRVFKRTDDTVAHRLEEFFNARANAISGEEKRLVDEVFCIVNDVVEANVRLEMRLRLAVEYNTVLMEANAQLGEAYDKLLRKVAKQPASEKTTRASTMAPSRSESDDSTIQVEQLSVYNTDRLDGIDPSTLQYLHNQASWERLLASIVHNLVSMEQTSERDDVGDRSKVVLDSDAMYKRLSAMVNECEGLKLSCTEAQSEVASPLLLEWLATRMKQLGESHSLVSGWMRRCCETEATPLSRGVSAPRSPVEESAGKPHDAEPVNDFVDESESKMETFAQVVPHVLPEDLILSTMKKKRIISSLPSVAAAHDVLVINAAGIPPVGVTTTTETVMDIQATTAAASPVAHTGVLIEHVSSSPDNGPSEAALGFVDDAVDDTLTQCTEAAPGCVIGISALASLQEDDPHRTSILGLCQCRFSPPPVIDARGFQLNPLDLHRLERWRTRMLAVHTELMDVGATQLLPDLCGRIDDALDEIIVQIKAYEHSDGENQDPDTRRLCTSFVAWCIERQHHNLLETHLLNMLSSE